MRLLDLAHARGVPVDWAMVLAGWYGVGSDYRSVSTEEVISYASRRLEDAGDPVFQTVLTLADADGTDRVLVSDCLQELARAEGHDPAVALRKWRLLTLQDLLSRMPDRPANGDDLFECLMSLTGFWADFEFPADAPPSLHRYREGDPNAWFSEASYREVLREHREWAAKEEALLYHRDGPEEALDSKEAALS